MVSPVVGCTIGNTKCAKFCTVLLDSIGINFCGVKAVGCVSASRIVITLSARWLINLALAHVPPPSILYGGMIITGDLVLLPLFDLWVAGAGLISGRINVGAMCLIAGTTPGVLLHVICWCVRVSFIKFLLAAGSHAFMIAGASEILVIGTMSSVSRCVATSRMLFDKVFLLPWENLQTKTEHAHGLEA